MFHIVLYQPDIPQNTGNIARLAVGLKCCLHLIEPLGFRLDTSSVRRAGLDYWEYLELKRHRDWKAFLEWNKKQAGQLFLITSKGERTYSEAEFKDGDIFLFGCETQGVSEEVFDSVSCSKRLCIPMPGQVRCLNLSNAVSVVLYEAYRQV